MHMCIYITYMYVYIYIYIYIYMLIYYDMLCLLCYNIIYHDILYLSRSFDIPSFELSSLDRLWACAARGSREEKHKDKHK